MKNILEKFSWKKLWKTTTAFKFFPRSKHFEKILFYFLWYTIATLIIGIVLKSLLVHHLSVTTKNLSDMKSRFEGAFASGHISEYLNTHPGHQVGGDGISAAMVAKKLPIFGKNQPWINAHATSMNDLFITNGLSTTDLAKQTSALWTSYDNAATWYWETRIANIFQILLIVLTLVLYPSGIIFLARMNKKDANKYTTKIHRRLNIEYLIFISLFIIMDTFALVLILREKPDMSDPWTLYSVISIFIPTGLASISLIMLSKIRKHVADKHLLDKKTRKALKIKHGF